jgi:hypothetical protein
MVYLKHALVVGLALLVSAGTLVAQVKNASKDDRITPERLGWPKGSTRTSEPLVTRVYKTDKDGDILKKQPDGYPFTLKADYTLKDNETVRVHEGVDLSSHPEKRRNAILFNFKAGRSLYVK